MIHLQRRRGSKGTQFALAEASAWHPWPGRTMNHPIFWMDSHFLTLHPPTGTGSTQLLHPLKKKRGKKLRRTKELGPHEQEHAGGPSWAWLRPWLAASRPPLPCPGRVSWGGKESPQPCGWLGLQAEMPEALQVCSGLWGSHGLALCTPDHCSALWPPQGRQGAPCRAGPTVDLGLETARPGRT